MNAQNKRPCPRTRSGLANPVRKPSLSTAIPFPFRTRGNHPTTTLTDMHEIIRISDPTGACAEIAPELGGWLLRYSRPVAGHGLVQVLHCDDQTVARYPDRPYAGNPTLFPAVSINLLPDKRGAYTWNGREFAMPLHGFAMRMPWKVVARQANGITMELRSTPETLRNYPFQFRFTLSYWLQGGVLHWDHVVENEGAEPMPFSSGIHPYLKAPLSSRSHRAACTLRIPEATQLHPHGDWERYTGTHSQAHFWSLANDCAPTLFFTSLARPEVALVDPVSGLETRLGFSGAPQHKYVAIWAESPASPFICVEPWTAMPNCFGRAGREDLTILPPNAISKAAFTLDVCPMQMGEQ